MDIIEYLAKDKKDYKCYEILKYLLETNDNFKNIIEEGIKEGKITGFTDELWDKINKQNIRGIDNFELVFQNGFNLGNCTGTSIQLSYSLDYPYICGGTLNLLKGTNNSDDGKHTWLIDHNKIIDTSLMLIIDKDYYLKLGYLEENKRNPNIEPRYNAIKDFTLDESLKRKK